MNSGLNSAICSDKQFQVLSGSQSDHAETAGQIADNLQRLPAD